MTMFKTQRSTLIAVAAAASTGALLWGILTAIHPPGGFTNAGSNTGAPATPSRTWEWRTPDAAGVIRYSDLITTPAPPNAAVGVGVSREQAKSIASGLKFGDLAPGEPRISLRYATRRFSADKSDGFEHRLVWLLEYANSPIMVLGPPNLPAADREAMEQNAACDFVIAIDAKTGEAVASLQSCRKATT